VKIKTIKKLKHKNITVDIEVENTHSYQLENGMVSHNTISQLVNSSSGIHERWSEYYIRTVRVNKINPLYDFMVDAGFPNEDCCSKPNDIAIFSFPIKSPETSILRHEIDVIDKLKFVKLYKDYYCEHNPSCTIYIKEDEWLKVGAWVYENFDEMTGLSFMPYSDHTYQQAPYQECTEEEYTEFLKKMPKNVEWEKLAEYENEDFTSSSQTLACHGDTCEIVEV